MGVWANCSAAACRCRQGSSSPPRHSSSVWAPRARCTRSASRGDTRCPGSAGDPGNLGDASGTGLRRGSAARVDRRDYSRPRETLRDDPKQPVAVRSSATTEDASDASFAGLQDTYLWVRGVDEKTRMIRSCWGSLYSVESISYRRQRQIPEENVAMAVVVQRMVDARTAGVMFTRSPVTGDRSVITIEGSWGLGSAVVGGEVTPDRWVVGKITGEISTRDISDKAIRHLPRPAGGIESVAVSETSAQPLYERYRVAVPARDCAQGGASLRAAQDIEWAVDRARGEIFLLQSRPETVWSAQDATPVGTCRRRSFSARDVDFRRPLVSSDGERRG